MRSDDSTSDEALLNALIVAGYGSCGGGDGQIEEVAKVGEQDCYSNGSHNTACLYERALATECFLPLNSTHVCAVVEASPRKRRRLTEKTAPATSLHCGIATSDSSLEIVECCCVSDEFSVDPNLVGRIASNKATQWERTVIFREKVMPELVNQGKNNQGFNDARRTFSAASFATREERGDLLDKNLSLCPDDSEMRLGILRRIEFLRGQDSEVSASLSPSKRLKGNGFCLRTTVIGAFFH
jgi:hypothetical protein